MAELELESVQCSVLRGALHTSKFGITEKEGCDVLKNNGMAASDPKQVGAFLKANGKALPSDFNRPGGDIPYAKPDHRAFNTRLVKKLLEEYRRRISRPAAPTADPMTNAAWIAQALQD